MCLLGCPSHKEYGQVHGRDGDVDSLTDTGHGNHGVGAIRALIQYKYVVLPVKEILLWR